MKRSEINSYIREAEELFEKHCIHLPPWAGWKPAEWEKYCGCCEAVFESRLGWDLTDFGGGAYLQRGLILITIRNGNQNTDIKPYAEKLMIIKENQETPMHFHHLKTEDIINRGGGKLVIKLCNSDGNEDFSDSDVNILTDGIRRTIKAGDKITLCPGESITIPRGMYHSFYAEQGFGSVIAGEISMTNDDETDNRFYEHCKRFPEIEEDQDIYRYLIGDYNRAQHGGTT